MSDPLTSEGLTRTLAATATLQPLPRPAAPRLPYYAAAVQRRAVLAHRTRHRGVDERSCSRYHSGRRPHHARTQRRGFVVCWRKRTWRGSGSCDKSRCTGAARKRSRAFQASCRGLPRGARWRRAQASAAVVSMSGGRMTTTPLLAPRHQRLQLSSSFPRRSSSMRPDERTRWFPPLLARSIGGEVQKFGFCNR